MTNQISHLLEHVVRKARELGIPEDMFTTAVDIILQNRDLVNAMDHAGEMDDYIYRAILKNAFDRRRKHAEASLDSQDIAERREAQRDLTVLKREELTSDAFYRAVLPLIVKVVTREPILRLHAEEASEIVLKLADFKRKFRTTSVTEIIVKRCMPELDALAGD
ncbi:MAG TPA: hypothetical protein VFZ78_10385 [Flavisolibacter sp.]